MDKAKPQNNSNPKSDFIEVMTKLDLIILMIIIIYSYINRLKIGYITMLWLQLRNNE